MKTYDPPRPWTRSYAEGVPEDLDPVSGSLIDIVEASARDYPDVPALEFFGRTTSYRDLDEQIRRAAAGLRDLGVGPGDPVAIVLPNCPQHIVAFYAILRVGAVVVEHNPLYTPRAASEAVRRPRCQARHRVDEGRQVGSGLPRRPRGEEPGLSGHHHGDAVPDAPHDPPAHREGARVACRAVRAVNDTVPWEDVVTTTPIPASHPKPATDDLALIQYTSGTTGPLMPGPLR